MPSLEKKDKDPPVSIWPGPGSRMASPSCAGDRALGRVAAPMPGAGRGPSKVPCWTSTRGTARSLADDGVGKGLKTSGSSQKQCLHCKAAEHVWASRLRSHVQLEFLPPMTSLMRLLSVSLCDRFEGVARFLRVVIENGHYLPLESLLALPEKAPQHPCIEYH